MIKTSDNTSCTGCGVCTNVCPQNAISLMPDAEGFLYPNINMDLCVRCDLCSSVCQIGVACDHEKKPEYYAAVHKDKSVLLKSSSGGVFSALADYAISKNGVVVGCAFDEDMKAIQIVAESKEGYAQFRGSKYVQSECNNVYQQTKQFLDDGKFVLFTGTPCQIAGLSLFLKKDYLKLVTVDIICHGVPSPALWKMHVEYLEEKGKRKLRSYQFRNKSKIGWSLYYYYYYYVGKKRPCHGISSLDVYYTSFLRGEDYRECCYSCKYANTNREGDFSIGDYWGIKIHHNEVDAHKGVSLLLVNTKKAHEMLPELSKSLDLIETKMEWCIKDNHNLVSPTPRPEIRDAFYTTIFKNGYKQWVYKFTHSKEWYIVKCKSLVPVILKNAIKKLFGRQV